MQRDLFGINNFLEIFIVEKYIEMKNRYPEFKKFKKREELQLAYIV